jgi:hypothetical protein
MSNLLQFSADTFSSLSTLEYASQWEQVGFDQLWEDEQLIITEFLRLAKGDTDIELNFKNVLLVKTNDDRMLQNVYGPSIFRESENGDGLVLKAGANAFPVILQNGKLTVGNFTGKFHWVTKKRLDESTYDVLVARLYDSTSEDDDPLMYEFGCSLAATDSTIDVNGRIEKNPLYLSQPKLDKLLDANAGLGQFFSAPKSGGGSIFKMQEMSANTEYEVIDVDATEPHPEYGVSYILRLAGGASCFARGNSATLLKKNFKGIKDQLKSGKTWTLKIGAITEERDKDGKVKKTYVNNALVARQAAMSGNAPKPIQQAQKAIAPVAATPNKPSSVDDLIKWATAKGVKKDVINGLFEDINAVAATRAAEGSPMSSEDKRDSFMASVEAGLKAQATQTLDTVAVAVGDDTETGGVDNIPF